MMVLMAKGMSGKLSAKPKFSNNPSKVKEKEA